MIMLTLIGIFTISLVIFLRAVAMAPTILED